MDPNEKTEKTNEDPGYWGDESQYESDPPPAPAAEEVTS